jgi:tripartite-type tricarboxylate transporter receptor subunit TctC
MDNLKRTVAFVFALASLMIVPTGGFTQTTNWPTRPITIVVPFPPGAAADFGGRLVRDVLEEQLGQPVVVENRPGATGTVGSAIVARAAPDGYTLLVTVNAPITMNMQMQKSFPFDPAKAFVPIIRIADVIQVLAVNSNLPIHTIRDLIDYGKKNSDKKINYGSSGVGSAHHLAGELLKQKTGLDLAHVPYRGGGPAMQDLIAGHIPIAFSSTPAALPQAQAGTIRIIGLAEEKRSPDLPNVPTISETVPGVITYTWVGVFAPAGTPQPIVARINKIVSDAIKKPEILAKMKVQGIAVAGGSSEDFASTIRTELDYWAKVVPSIGIKPE